jgi:acetylornithine/succinyldiaminopimelate/putrescine aminotransferase
MTASFSLRRFVDLMRMEVGQNRGGHCPFDRFLCLNSGSEGVTMAARFSDLNAMIQTSPGGPHEGKTIKFLSVQGSFHGRTDRPAQASASGIKKYKTYLASFRDRNNLVTIEPNNIMALEQVFAEAEKQGTFYEALFLEPVMGEGNPGLAVTPEFYKSARELTKEHHGLLLIDSIQAGLRTYGCLSICDYPGFESLDPPDIETYSKAINAGQYPLSVLAITKEMADLYKTGLYGNTMTANPRALDVACEVLSRLTDHTRKNIRQKGVEFVEKFKNLAKEFPDVIEQVQGTGLLISIAISPTKYHVTGFDGLEIALRKAGLGVIHGGTNSLRFTPHFAITSEEIDLVVDLVRQAFLTLPPLA